MFGSKTVIGLDIGSDKVKAIQLKKRGNRLEVEKFGIADVYPNGDKSSPPADPRELKTQAIRRAIDDARITAKYCVSAVSGESIIVRYIQLPQMPEAELKNALRWEAEEYIPFHIDEVNIDSVVLGPSATAGKVDVLLVSAKKDLVSEHVGLVRGVGLTPVIVDVDSFAFLNSYEIAYEPQASDCVALVNIGAEITNINIYLGGTSRFSRDISIAGNAVTQSIVQKTSVPYKRAEEMKQAIGAPMPENAEATEEEESSLISSIRGTVERITGSDLGDETLEASVNKATRNVLMNLVGEIRRSVQFFENQAGGHTVSRLILGGGTSRMPHLPQFLSSELEMEVELFDPLRNFQVASGVNTDLLSASKEHLGVAIGLALRKVVG
ncbi:type IV pilus assembly protein PilM [bacterium]|nr:type IV pilus assembly protein PilM [bacterium]